MIFAPNANKQERSKANEIDLSGITQALFNRRVRELEEYDNLYHGLKAAARSRRKLVRDETAAKNRIHACVDVLFPGFLKEKNVGIQPFCEASMWLMSKDFS